MSKNRNKKKIAYDIAKEFWNNIDVGLRVKILEGFLYDYFFLRKADWSELALLSKADWNGLSLSNCNIPIGDIRSSILCYLGIGDYENMSSDYYGSVDLITKEYQREYKLRMLKLK
jgi:hypothetical protein